MEPPPAFRLLGVDEDDFRTLGTEGLDDAGADAGTTAGDEDRFSSETGIGRVSAGRFGHGAPRCIEIGHYNAVTPPAGMRLGIGAMPLISGAPNSGALISKVSPGRVRT